MSAVARLFREWLAGWIDDGGAVHHIHQDDLEEAFVAGWEARHNAQWVTSAVPMLGIEGGEDRGPVDPPVFVVLEGPDMTYYGDAELHGIYASRESAEAKAREVRPDWEGKDFEPLKVFEMKVEP